MSNYEDARPERCLDAFLSSTGLECSVTFDNVWRALPMHPAVLAWLSKSFNMEICNLHLIGWRERKSFDLNIEF